MDLVNAVIDGLNTVHSNQLLNELGGALLTAVVIGMGVVMWRRGDRGDRPNREHVRQRRSAVPPVVGPHDLA